jgi:hypothetical protein
MSPGVKPFTVTKKQAKELLSPRLVDRLIYAARNFPEMEWLEILPKEHGKEVRETYIVLRKPGTRVPANEAGEYPPEMPSDAKYRQERQAFKEPFRVVEKVAAV